MGFGPCFLAVIAFQAMTSLPQARSITRSPVSKVRNIRLLAIGGILAAFALRLHDLGGQSLWYDETVSAFLAQQSIPDLIAHTARDIHPPGYYLLLHVWGWLAQPTLETGLEFIYAWPSLFWGLLLLPLIFALGCRFFTTRVALVALWLTAVHPYHIWYSQEVRMYTMGAGLGLLCLWATLGWLQKETDRSRISRSRFLYIFAAAAGLYTLYYFAFLLIALNVLVIWHQFAIHPAPLALRRSIFPWLLANGAALLLWSPWLPTFWRQMTDPPVPPWRGTVDIASLAQETLAALLVGQSPPLATLWPWALAAGLLVALALIGFNRREMSGRGEWVLLIYLFLPLVLMAGISLTLTPLYHIRYFFTYAVVGTLLFASVFDRVVSDWRWLHAISLVGLILLSGWSLNEFWTKPLYRADDHRSAVAELAQNWRPGDAVLINAGWAYTALAVYWPPAPSRVGGQPITFPVRMRFDDYTKTSFLDITDREVPLLLLAGSVDGSANLGWGMAESDFYAISRSETEAALEAVAARQPRIWQYRIYDTVSDPAGAVRAWLDTHTTPRLDLPYPGRDFLRVQLFETDAFNNPENCPQTSEMAVTFGDGMVLRGASLSPTPQAGSTLYATLCWQIAKGLATENLRTSLRLYGLAGGDAHLIAQKDDASFLDTTTRSEYRTSLALPIPAATQPGNYRLEVIVYDGTTGDPLPIDNPGAIVGQRWPLAEAIEIGPTE